MHLECAVSMPSSRDLRMTWARQGSSDLYCVLAVAGKVEAIIVVCTNYGDGCIL